MNLIKGLITTLIVTATSTLLAQQVQTIAGNKGTKFGVDAISVRLGTLKSTAIDAAGNIYYADDYWIMKKDAVTGIVSKLAGTGVSESNAGKVSATGSCATCVGIFSTANLSIDQKNNFLYITSNDVNLLKLDLNTNLIYSIAGGAVQYGNNNGDGGLATSATIPGAQKIQTDSSGNIYFIQNFLDQRIRKINKATGIITTVLGGNSNTPSLDGSLGINATLTSGVFSVDPAGNIFYYDNGKLRKLDNQTGVLSTIAGNASPGQSGDGVLASNATVGNLRYLHIDNQNNIYMYKDNIIRKINGSDSKVYTIAGSGIYSSQATGDGGLATLANFNSPVSINTDNANNVYVVDDADFSIRKIDATTNIISRVIGVSTYSGDGGLATNANLNEPGPIAIDKSGNIYIADVLNHRIRKQNKSTGIITTVVGNGSVYTGMSIGTTISTYYNGKNANEVSINSPVAIALDSSENLYIADQGLRVLLRVALPTGKIYLIGGNAPAVSSTNSIIGDGASVANATFSTFSGLAVDNFNDLYIADYINNIIRKVDVKTNIISTVVGSYTTPSQNGFSGDGGLATKAKVYYPRGLTFDANNNLYFSDYQNQVLRKVDYATGIITTIAGMPNIFGYDGDGGSSKEAMIMNALGGLATDKKNNFLYFADNDNSRIRRINLKSSVISTLVGTGQAGFNGDTLAPLDTKISMKINFNAMHLSGVAVDTTGDVYFSDQHNNLIRKVIEPLKVALPPSPDTLLPRNITIHRDKFVSLQMTQAEYDEWVKEDFFTYGPKSIKVLKEVYSRFKDNFDFLICNLNAPIVGQTKITYGGVNVAVSNKVKNIGRDIMDLADSYGAANGRLKSTIQLVGNGITNSPLLHEIVHTYANFTIDSVGFYGSGLTDKMLKAHWGFTGGNTKGQLGGFVQNTLQENVNGIANQYSVASFGQIANGGNVVPFSEFELYTMGIIPVDSVKTFDAFKGIQSLTENNGVSTFTANSRITFNKAKIESTLGVRVPSAANAQKDFNALFIVLTPRALTNAEIDQYDNEITKMTKRGDDSTSFYNFWEATNGLGTLNASGLSNSLATGTIEKLDTNVCAGAYIRFKAYPLMNGGIRPKYQWYKNGAIIAGENLNIFSSNNLVNNDIIRCKISNSVDSVMAEHTLVLSGASSFVAPTVKDTSFCLNSIATLVATSNNGNTLKWYGTNLTGGTASDIAIVPATSDTITKSYYVSQINSASGCESPRAKITVTINTLPASPLVKDTTYCNNINADTLMATSLVGHSLIWYGSNATGGTASALGIKPNTNAVGTINYYVSQKNTSTGCEGNRAKIGVTISALPAAPLVKDTAYCKNINADTLKATSLTGHTLSWYGTSVTGGIASALGIKPNTSTAGTLNYYVSQKNNTTGCEGARAKIGVVINPLPVAPVVKDTSYCINGSSDTLRVTPSPGATLLWYGTSATGGTGTITAIKPSTATVGTANFYLSQIITATGCEGPRAKIMVTTNAIPIAPALTRDTANNLISGAAGTTWFKDGSALTDTAQKFKPTSAGSYTAKITTNGCTSLMSTAYYYLVTDIINLSNEEFIKLAPNPFINNLNFDFVVKGYQKLNMDVFDLVRGNKVASMQNLYPGVPIYLGQLSPGTYVIKVSSNDLKVSYQFKMVKL